MVQEAVFQLQVAMCDIVLVNMLHARTNLAEYLSCLSVIEALALIDVIEDLSICGQLGNDVVCIALFLPVGAERAASGPQNRHHMRMVHALLGCHDLLIESLLSIFVQVLEHLHDTLAVVTHVFCKVCDSKSAVTNLVKQLEVLDCLV